MLGAVSPCEDWGYAGASEGSGRGEGKGECPRPYRFTVTPVLRSTYASTGVPCAIPCLVCSTIRAKMLAPDAGVSCSRLPVGVRACVGAGVGVCVMRSPFCLGHSWASRESNPAAATSWLLAVRTWAHYMPGFIRPPLLCWVLVPAEHRRVDAAFSGCTNPAGSLGLRVDLGLCQCPSPLMGEALVAYRPVLPVMSTGADELPVDVVPDD